MLDAHGLNGPPGEGAGGLAGYGGEGGLQLAGDGAGEVADGLVEDEPSTVSRIMASSRFALERGDRRLHVVVQGRARALVQREGALHHLTRHPVQPCQPERRAMIVQLLI